MCVQLCTHNSCCCSKHMYHPFFVRKFDYIYPNVSVSVKIMSIGQVPMDTCEATPCKVAEDVARQQSCRRLLPATPGSNRGSAKASRFLHTLANAPSGSRRVELAKKLALLEKQREQTRNRIKKHRQRLRELSARLTADETIKAGLDDEISSIKADMEQDATDSE